MTNNNDYYFFINSIIKRIWFLLSKHHAISFAEIFTGKENFFFSSVPIKMGDDQLKLSLMPNKHRSIRLEKASVSFFPIHQQVVRVILRVFFFWLFLLWTDSIIDRLCYSVYAHMHTLVECSEKQMTRARRIVRCQILLSNIVDFFFFFFLLLRTLENLFVVVVDKREKKRVNSYERFLIFSKMWHRFFLVLIVILIVFFIFFSFSFSFCVVVSVYSKPIEMVLILFISCTYSLDWLILYHHYMLYLR
jgi:hypothetical protein